MSERLGQRNFLPLLPPYGRETRASMSYSGLSQ